MLTYSQIFPCLHLFPCAGCGSLSLSIGFITVRPKRLMEESQTKDGHRTTIASGGSSAPSPLVSLHSRKRLRERMPSPPRQWKREDAPWHRDKGTTEQQTPAGPRPFLPAAGPLPFRPAGPRPFLPAAGPLPFLPASVLLGRANPATLDAQREPAQAPPVNATARQGLPSPGSNEQALMGADLLTNAAIHDLQADCPLCNCLTLQVGNQRRCMMFPGCPFNWRVGWTPYW